VRHSWSASPDLRKSTQSILECAVNMATIALVPIFVKAIMGTSIGVEGKLDARLRSF